MSGSTQQEPPKEKKKKHTGLIIAASAAVVVVIAAVLAFVFAGDIIKNKFMLMTKSDRDYFRWISSRKIDNVCRDIELADSALKLAGESKSGSVEEGSLVSDIKAHISEEFTDMLNIYPIKDIGIRTSLTYSEDGYSFSLKPSYNNRELLTLNALYDKKNGKIEAELPEYKSGVIDLSSILTSEFKDGKTLEQWISDYTAQFRESAGKYTDFDKDKVIDAVKRYGTALADSIEDVTLVKDSSVSIDKESVDCTEIKISMNGKQLRDQLDTIADMVWEDYSDKINELSKDANVTLSLSDIKDAISKIDDNVSGKLTLYVNKRAEVIAFDAKAGYDSTMVGIKIRWKEDEEKGSITDIGISLNSLNAITIRHESKTEDDKTVSKTTISPDSVIDMFLGDFQGLSLQFDSISEEKSSSFTVRLKKNGNELASLTQELTREEYKGFLFDDAGKTIYPVEDMENSGYLVAEDVIDFAIGLLDKIAEPMLEEKINELLEQYFGEGVDINQIREFYKNNTPGGASSDPGDGTQTGDAQSFYSVDDPLALNDAGYPTRRNATVMEYPDSSKTYYYSHAELAGYASPGQYRGRTFVMPAPQEVTPEAFEAEKKKFLDSYKDTILVDQNTAVVEWGDEIYLDIVPYMYGMEMSSFRFNNSYAKMGDEMYGENLDEQIIGMKVGETKSITTTLNDQYGGFAGVEATFHVTVTKIDRYVKPEWTEAFICGTLGYESLDACSDELMKSLVVETEVSDDEILYKLEEEAKAETQYSDIPQEEYYKLWNGYYNEIYDMTEPNGQTPEEYFADQGYDRGQFYSMLDSDLEADLHDYCFYAAIAQKEGISLTGDEVKEAINDYMEYTETASFEELMKLVRLDQIIDYEIISKIKAIMLETAVIAK